MWLLKTSFYTIKMWVKHNPMLSEGSKRGIKNWKCYTIHNSDVGSVPIGNNTDN